MKEQSAHKRPWRSVLATVALVVISLVATACLNKIPAVAKYQVSATEKCLKTHTADQCRVLPYPSTQPTFEGQVATAEVQ